jgi:phosphomannomutase
VSEELLARARAWLAEDPDPDTRAELARLIEGDDAAVAERFAGRLEFGTAGLRGALGAGPLRMNRAVVRRTTAGLASYLATRGQTGPVVVGYDARHKSDVFAEDVAAVITGAGLSALVLPRPLPTPVLAFAVRQLQACAGVMVTASHNPRADNGYKVYLGDGAQIVSPADAEISAAIDAVGPLAGVALADGWQRLGDEVVEAYLDAVIGLSLVPDREVRVAYTPLHGVGRDVLLAAFARAGFPVPTVVAEQAAPDPDFPTLAFPNPEEPGATELLLATAARAGADIALANDPDADRLAVAVEGRLLTGDELGVLLADHILRHTSGDRLVATTIVSSSLLGKLARAHGVAYAETLTGFKWIVRAADAYPGHRFVFGYEEALGYVVGDVVRDKDGISAALAVAELAAAENAAGRTLLDRLDELAMEHGVHATEQVSIRVTDLPTIAEVMADLRGRPPSAVGGSAVIEVVDLLRDGRLPAADVLVYPLESGGRVVVRPSGTEPKLKAYLEAVVPVAEGRLADARARAGEQLAALHHDVRRRFAGSDA